MPTAADPRLLRCSPYFPTADVDAAVAHYGTVLGFEAEYVAGSPSEFAIVGRDGLSLMLRRVPEPERIRPSEAQGGTWDAFFWVRGLDALHQELAGRGAEVAYGPIVQEAYGMREFAVRTPDGHVLGFGEPLA